MATNENTNQDAANEEAPVERSEGGQEDFPGLREDDPEDRLDYLDTSIRQCRTSFYLETSSIKEHFENEVLLAGARVEQKVEEGGECGSECCYYEAGVTESVVCPVCGLSIELAVEGVQLGGLYAMASKAYGAHIDALDMKAVKIRERLERHIKENAKLRDELRRKGVAIDPDRDQRRGGAHSYTL